MNHTHPRPFESRRNRRAPVTALPGSLAPFAKQALEEVREAQRAGTLGGVSGEYLVRVAEDIRRCQRKKGINPKNVRKLPPRRLLGVTDEI